jgi:phospholipid/cholesterol/gamma-HCH transport system substrate-binding protein
MAERHSKIKLGGFVAGGIASLAVLAVLFGGSPQVFSDKAPYTLAFAEAPNVAPGVPVRKSGVKIGEVVGVDLDPDSGQVKVHVRVDKKYLPRQSDEAQVSRGLLSGDTTIDFVPRSGPDGQPISVRGEPYPPGETITGITPVNTSKLAAQAAGVLPNAQESLAKMLNTFQRLENAMPKIERAFDEVAGLARSGRELMPELRKTNEKVQEVLAFNDQPPPDGVEQPGLKATLTELRDFLRETKPLVADVKRIVRTNEADITATVKNVRQTSEAINDLLTPENRRAFASLMKNLDTASADLSPAIRLAAVVLDQGEKTLKEINARLAQAGTALRSAESAFKNLETATKPLADQSGPVLQNVAVAADQLAKTLAEARQTLAMVNRADGTLQKVLADPALYNHLNEAAISLQRTLVRAEKIAADLQVFADKVARRPEMIGIGGAVRPSTGLKESPGAALPVQPLPPVRESDRK